MTTETQAPTLPELLEQIEAAVTTSLTDAHAALEHAQSNLRLRQRDMDKATADAAAAGWTPTRIADHIGMSASHVSTRIRRHHEDEK